MSEILRPTRYPVRAFQPMARFHRFRTAVSALLLIALSLGTPYTLRAGDILRGGASAKNADRNAADRAAAGADAAQAAKVRAQDRLARTTKAVNDMRALQASARAASGASTIPNGLASGGMKVLTGANAKWQGANAPTQNGNTVDIKQTASTALLHWETFHVGRDTTVNFDQSSGGTDAGKWIAFNKVFDPAAKPSEIRGKINAQGQVYIINQNGIIFGAGSQVNARALVASTLPINDNLVTNGLLNNKDAQFLFSALEVPGGSDGTPTFTPTDVPATLGDVIVERGAKISSPELAGGNGGRVMLVGANVRNEGEISTPAGQTILAAGLQVGVQAHNSSDPSLRGLDAWVGTVGDYAGTVSNTGLIEAKTGSILAVGKQINQSGILESTTSVNLNGRIDLLASFGAVSNPNYDNADKPGGGAPIFLNQFTGGVVFAPGSLTRIVPDYDSTKSVPGIKLSQNSRIQVLANTIDFASDSILFAPSGDVRLRTGTWPYKDVGDNRTIFQADGVTIEDGLAINFADEGQRFFLNEGSIHVASTSVLDVSGTPDVFVPQDQYIREIQLRGTELADSPLQRSLGLRGKTLTVDLRRSGTYGGRFWIGTPLGDATGLANIIERNVAQLTTRGGTIEMTTGGSIAIDKGSEINVSGGYTRNEGGFSNTTKVMRSGQLLDISAATPDVAYEGIYQEATKSVSAKWGIEKSFQKILSPLARTKEPSYIEGAAGGSLKLTSPSIQLEGKILGNIVTGPKQLAAPPALSSLSLTFRNQKRVEISGVTTYLNSIASAPAIVLASQDLVSGLPISGRDLAGTLSISPEIFSEKGGGFGVLNIDNTDGTILVPKNNPMELPAGGALALKATNIEILSSILIAGGSLSMSAYNYSPYGYAEESLDPIFNSQPAPSVVEGRGIIQIGPSAFLKVGGTNFDERAASTLLSDSRRVLDGGSVTMEAYSILMHSNSGIDASGGIGYTARGKIYKGNGGSISLLAGKDPILSTSAGGTLQLPGTLQAFSALKGGSLKIQAPEIVLAGTPGDQPILSQGTRLALSPAFFEQGGFTNYSLVSTGLADSTNPGITVQPGTIIKPVAQTLVASNHGNQLGRIAMEPRLLPEGVRSPASLSLQALGFDDPFTQGKIESIGAIVVGEGALVQTDPQGKVALRGQTLNILGTINTPAGQITLQSDGKYPLAPLDPRANNNYPLATLYLAPSAKLLAQGATIFTPDPFGRRTGQVLNGGTITLKGNVVAEQGSILDVSGSTDQLDIHPSFLSATIHPSPRHGLTTKPWGQSAIRTRVDSNGGTISLQGAQMLFSDATLHGFAGGPSAIGGLLSISSAAFSFDTGADTTLFVTQTGKVIDSQNRNLGVGMAVVGADGVPISGKGYFAASKFANGGFDSLDLGYEKLSSDSGPVGGNVNFVGPVTINAPGFIRLASGGVITANDRVVLNASYIKVGQEFLQPLNPNDLLRPIPMPIGSGSQPDPVLPTPGPGLLSMNAQLVDVGTTVLKNISNLSITATNGDIRGSGFLNVAGTVSLTAAQIYPTTLSRFEIFAYGVGGTVQINPSGSRALPLSAGGRLSIYAENIINTGTLRAPFGSITLGWDGSDTDTKTDSLDTPSNPVAGSGGFPVTKILALRAGSSTSVSGIDPLTGQGIVVPFGLSPDGNSWIDPRGVNVTTAGMPEKIIRLAAESITQEPNSQIDLRGGGDLMAFRWISGPGGSADILGTPSLFNPTGSYSSAKLVSYNGKTYSSRMALDPADFNGKLPTPGKTAYWLEIPDSYAILPGFQSQFAPYNPFNTGSSAGALGGDPGYVSSLKLGDRIVLDGNSALPAGAYTLLPRRYGVFPGAYLVTPLNGSINPYTNAEGATFASAYRANFFSSTSQAPMLRSNFEILTPSVLANRAEYEVYSANQFLPQAASALRTTVNQPLPLDAGSLGIHGVNALSLAGMLQTSAPGGIGAAIDISSSAAITIGKNPAVSGVFLDSRVLNSWNAESLLVGGQRRLTSSGTVVDVKTPSLTLDGAELTGSDVILAAQTTLNLADGSAIRAGTSPSGTVRNLATSGGSAVVRVNAVEAASFDRTGSIPDDSVDLNIGSGVALSGASITIDSTKNSDIADSANILANKVAVGAGKILLNLDGSAAPDDSYLLLGGDPLAKLSAAKSLALSVYSSSLGLAGSGTLGSSNLALLDIKAGGIADDGGDAVFQANTIRLSNPNTVAASADSTATGQIRFQSDFLKLGDGTFSITDDSSVQISASKGVLVAGSGSLRTKQDLSILTPAIASARLSTYQIQSLGALNLDKTPGAAGVSSELGASLSLTGSTVRIGSDISLPSGELIIRSTSGDVTIDSALSVAGSSQTFFDTVRFADAGQIKILSDAGSVVLTGDASLSVRGDAAGGRAGTLDVAASAGSFVIGGSLLGSAKTGYDGGSFKLDVGGLPDYASLNNQLETGGFSASREIRVRSGDLTIGGTANAKEFRLSTDAGNILVSGTIDASGSTGGTISLISSGSLNLSSGASLSVRADKFNSAGKGGLIELFAGSQINGAIDATAKLSIESGSSIDLSVAQWDSTGAGSSAARGQFQGVLHLRAPRNDTDILIDPIAGSISGASAIVAEGYKIYEPADGVMDIALRDSIHAESGAFMAHEGDIQTRLLTGRSDDLSSLFVVAPGVEIINTTGDITLGLANPTGTDNIEGTSAADWDLSTWRYGSKNAPGLLTLRAKGDIIFNNSLSDGFVSVTPGVDDPTIYSNGLSFDANGHSRLWLAQLQTIQDNLPINAQSWSYTITAGADLSASKQGTTLALDQLDEGKGSVLVGEFYPAKPNPDDGSLNGDSYAGVGPSGTTANNLRINQTARDETTYDDVTGDVIHEGTGLLLDKGTRYEVVRTGTGDISVNAGRDVQLRNQFATIYTAGVAIPASSKIYSDGDFVVPIVNFESGFHPEQPNMGYASQQFIPQWAMAGGNLKISAANDIARVTQFTNADGLTTTVFDSSHQMTSNWLYRRGYVDPATGKFGAIQFSDFFGNPVTDASASTTWWVDYSNFFQGFGALGGGNVQLGAGHDVVNADAVAPTNARMAGLDYAGNPLAPSVDNLLEFGGGDLRVSAGRNIDGGLYYVERGQGVLKAGAAIKTNSSRSPSLGLLNRLDDSDTSNPDYFPTATWLPTSLFLGKGSFEIAAKKDILLGPMANAFLMPVGMGNKYWYKTYFSTYSPDSAVNVSSTGGAITFRSTTVLPFDSPGTTNNILSVWLNKQNLFNTSAAGTPSSSYQPWSRLAEENLTTFSSVLNLIPPTLQATAFAGDLNVAGNLLLSPAPNGNLELIAGGAIQGLQVAGETTDFPSAWISSSINVSDANPSVIPSALSPLNYYGYAGGSDLYLSNSALMNYLDQSLNESGSFAGNDAAIDLKIKRHGTGLLHSGDTAPVKIYASGGDFTGFNVFAPKQTRLVSGGDISDVALYIQNVNASDISIVSAAGDILPFNSNSKLRTIATDASAGNAVFDLERQTASGKPVSALAGDIQVSGPGILEVLAGRNIDLGTGENISDGTGVGITSIGNARNPNLPFEGASLIVLAGVKGRNTPAALGLANSQLALDGLKDIDPGVKPIVPEFSTPEHQAVAVLQTLFALLQATGKNYPDTASYEPGLTAVEKAFATVSGTGDIFTRARDIRTVSGGAISLLAPQGGLTMASDIYGNPLTPPGIVTEYGGSVSIITDGDVDIGRARIFTLRGGDMTIWSSQGDIAAGTSPKTVVTAPPTRVLIDSPSADVKTDLGGLATGGGIGVLASVEDVPPGNVYLLAPTGSVDAGDAGIQSTGNLNIAAVTVVNADNIASSGTSTGVPSSAPAAAAPVSISPGASSSSAATSSAAQNMTSQNQAPKEVEQAPSMFSVEILGYGGGEGDGEKDDDAEKRSAMQ